MPKAVTNFALIVFLFLGFSQLSHANEFKGLRGLLRACLLAGASNHHNLRLEDANEHFYGYIASSPYRPKLKNYFGVFIRHPHLRPYVETLFSPGVLYRHLNGSDIFHINIPTGGARLHLAVDIQETAATIEFRPGFDDGTQTILSGLDIDRFEHIAKNNSFFENLRKKFPQAELVTLDQIPDDQMPRPYLRIHFDNHKSFGQFLKITDDWFKISDPNRAP